MTDIIGPIKWREQTVDYRSKYLTLTNMNIVSAINS